MPNTATRLINLILLLQRQPGQKAAGLAEQLGVSVRTLHRYLAMLDEMGIPVYSERGPYGGFSLVRGYRMPPLILTPEESVAVYLGVGLVEQMWGRLYCEAARGALAKLENLLPDEQRQEAAWARRFLVATGLHRSDLAALTPTLETLRQAAREQRQVQIRYQSLGKKNATERRLDPYGIVHRWGWWYVVGLCRLRGEVRTFRVDRISTPELLKDPFEIPESFDLRTYLENELKSQPQVAARLRFATEAAGIALESRPYWEKLERQADGSVVVTFTAPSLEWAASTVLAYGALPEVLDPPELRQMVKDWARRIVDKYSDQGAFAKGANYE